MGASSGMPQREIPAVQEPAFTPADIAGLVADELGSVETLFRRSVASPIRIVDEIGAFLADGGGKRVRPMLHLLCAKMCGYRGPHGVLMATVLECIHSATLIHDDIIDEATTRRGRPSVNQSWGNNITVLFGDYLYAKAMEMALDAGSLRIMRSLAEITLRMTEGEMLQTRYVGRLDLTVAEHLDLVERKTAALFGGCCEIAGLLAQVGPEREEALRRYGLKLGLAFQLVDDLLDFTGDPARLGKPAASDLREGKATLAVIDLLSRGEPRALELARAVVAVGNGGPGPEIAELRMMLHETGAIVRSQARARRYAEEAAAELKRFPDTPVRRALQAVPDLLVFRDR